jgi:hypothetical protein
MAGYIGSKSSVTLVDGYTEAEADAEFVTKTGDTMSGNLTVNKSQNSEINLEVTNTNTGSDAQVRTKYTTDGGLFTVGKTSDAHSFAGDAYIYNVDNTNIRFATSDTERMRIESSGKVGIGTSSPSYTLDVYKSSVGDVARFNSTSGNRSLDITSADNGAYLGAEWDRNINSAGGIHTWSVNDTERMRIDSSGNLLVGTTDTQPPTNNDASGIALRADGKIAASRSNGISGDFNTGANGDIVWFRKSGTVVGTIGVVNGDHLVIAATYSTGTGLKFSNNLVKPVFDSGADKDNAADFGSASARWDDLYATNGSIQTSDFNEKQDIASLTATEMLVGKRISALFKTFRWKDSVAEKGDNARTHTGVIAQDVQAAFTAEGLDAGDYALFISSTWWETQTEVPAVEAVEAVDAVTETTTDEDGNEVVTVITEAVEAVEAKDAYTRTDTYDTEDEAPEGATERTRMGIRYPELLSFVAAYNEQRFASIEARLTALEA